MTYDIDSEYLCALDQMPDFDFSSPADARQTLLDLYAA